MPPKRSDADAYLAKLSPGKRATLLKVRKAIRAAAPEAKEGMSYGMPAFIQGKPIAGYTAGANHCAYYPMSGAITETLKADLEGYETSKGAIRFPIGKPLPASLIRKLVKARLLEIAAGGKPRPATRKAARVAAGTSTGFQAYLRELDHPLKTDIAAVRAIILGASPSITEGIKWNVPSFRTQSDWFATFNVRAKDSVQLIFHTGAKAKESAVKGLNVADPAGLAKWLAKDRCLVTLGAGSDLKSRRAAFQAFVRAWIKQV